MSRGWAGADPTRLGERLEVVPELLRFCERQQLLQALILDLADPLARDVERPPDLVERARMLAVEAVAQLEHRPLAVRERTEDLPQRLFAQRHLRRLVGQLLVLVGEEVPELGLVVVADRFFERHRCLRALADLLDLVRAEVEVLADLRRDRLATELGAQLPFRADDLVQLLDDVKRHPNRPRLVGKRTRNRLTDPPGRVSRELETPAVIELLRGADETDRPLLDQIEERQALIAVLLRDRDDQ